MEDMQGEKSAGVHSFIPVLVQIGKAIVWGYTLSCLLVNWVGGVQGASACTLMTMLSAALCKRT